MTVGDHHLETVCRGIGRRLRQLALQRGNGSLSEDAFIDKVLRIEAEEVTPNGLTLTASNTIDDWTVLKVKVNGTGEPCVAFEFEPESGEFRPVGFAGRI